MPHDALEASIEHWKQNVEAETPDKASTSADDCALCCKFEWCRDCPVFIRTGNRLCEGSPYVAADKALTRWNHGEGTREAFRTAAQAELDFLISLREPE